jgi:hypothetical protein
MNQEILERLLIDRASGELTPDVSALLKHCLAREPALALAAKETEEALRLAKQAMTLPVAPRLPEPGFRKVAMLVYPREFSARRQAPLWALGMAACFLGGLLSGGILLSGRQLPSAPEIAAQTSVIAKTAPAQSGFWSIDRLVAKDAAARPVAASPLIWKSPVRTPELRTQ